MTNDSSQVAVQKAVNDEVSVIGQTRDPLSRAKRAGELIHYLSDITDQVAGIRRRAVAEALEWPGGSMNEVTAELGLSRSAVVKLAPTEMRQQMADELRQRLAKGLESATLATEHSANGEKGLDSSETVAPERSDVPDSAEAGESAIARLAGIRDSLDSLTADRGVTGAQLLAAYGWWSRIVRTAQAIVVLHRAGLAHEAAPLVRTNLHHSIALQWLIAYPDEARAALAWEQQSQGSKMLRKAIEEGWDLDPDAVWDPPADKAPEGYRYLQSTEALCEKMGARDACVSYLAESKLTHPTGFSADVYATVDHVLLRDPVFSAPLSGVALVATDSTARFAALAHLTVIENEATQLREMLLSFGP